MNKTLYMCIIEELSRKEAFIQLYWARANHIGEAIWIMLDAARQNGLSNPIPRECDPFDLDDLDMQVAPDKTAKVFWSENRDFFDPEPVFELPFGIIGSSIEAEHDVDEITKGYTHYTDKKGLIYLDVNVEASGLFVLYSKLLRLYPSYKVFWYVLHGHWEKARTDKFLINETFNTPAKIIEHLNEDPLNSIFNGFVSLTAYLEEGSSNLKISDHKRIGLSTFSRTVADQFRDVLENDGYPETKNLVCIDFKMHHWHYRIPGSKTKGQLEQSLIEAGFTDWKTK